jgi:hypothetical protein
MNPLGRKFLAGQGVKMAVLTTAILVAGHSAQAEETAVAKPQATAVVAAVVDNPKLNKALLDDLKEGQWEQALQALAAGANPNAQAKDGMTALMLAAQGGKPDIVKALLERGAQVNATNKAGQTALHLATTIGQPKPKKKKFGGFGGLLGGVAMGGAMGGLGDKAGFASSLLGSGGVDALLGDNLKGLLQSGVFNLSGTSGWKAVIGTALQGDLKNGGALGIQNLLGGSNIDAQGWVNLLSSVKGSNTDVFSAMGNLAGGAGVEDVQQWTQFLGAASAGDLTAVQGLMGNQEFAPLLGQALQGFSSATDELPANAARKIVGQLVEKGADFKAVDKTGKTVAELLEARGWEDVSALLTAQVPAAAE